MARIAECQQNYPTEKTIFSSHSPIVLYHLIRGAAALERRAVELDTQNGSGNSLRDAFSETVGLHDADLQAFIGMVRSADQRFTVLDQQAAQIIEKSRSSRTTGGLVPPPPPELSVLQTQKNELIRQLPSVLDQSQLSNEGRFALDNYLRRAAQKTKVVDPNAQ